MTVNTPSGTCSFLSSVFIKFSRDLYLRGVYAKVLASQLEKCLLGLTSNDVSTVQFLLKQIEKFPWGLLELNQALYVLLNVQIIWFTRQSIKLQFASAYKGGKKKYVLSSY